ncbi:trigger factor [Fimbriiglobus ruber]|uniref:Trigger factor n=1 Tax=Fimbriiglobus ruber TaxID=1908690 RepID=A0A225DBF3_9BACT|nr:trigger factor [Fimbriiglobus ruber]OWK36984.1 Cell division trigger factor [Fimbriiglobus ruber]
MAAEDTPADDTATATALEGPTKLPQEVVITDAGPCKKHVKVTVDRAAIDARMDEKYTELMVKTPAHVPGFRPGKAPRKIIEKKFFKDVAAEVKSEVLMASLEQLAEEQTLSPLSPPELDPGAVVIPEFGPLVYEFNIEVRPEFDLPNYKGLKLRRPTHAYTDNDVLKETKRFLEPYGKPEAKTGTDGGAPTVALEDLVTADVVVKAGDKEINKLSGISLKVEKRLAMADGVAEDFAGHMVGAKPGDTRTVDITLSQDLANASLRGTKVQAAFTIKDVKVVRTPELTPELLADFGVRGVEQFHELIRARLERILEYTQRQTARSQILEQLAGNANWEMPVDLLTRQARKTLQRRVMEMKSAGFTDEQIQGRQRVLEQDAVKSTAAALKEHFVLQKIAELEKLEIEDADIDHEIDEIADRTGESPRKVKARMEKEDLIEALATELLERKALDFVLSTAEYEDYELTPAESDQAEVSSVDAQAAPAAEGESPDAHTVGNG